MARKPPRKRNPRNPSSTVFWNDLRGDAALRRCSLAARGLWAVHALPCAAESPAFGVLIVGSLPSRLEDLGDLFALEVGKTPSETQALFNELVEKGAASVDDQGRVYCRRMVREEAKRQAKVEAGRSGGQASGEARRAKQTPSRTPSKRASTTPSKSEAPEMPFDADGSSISGASREAEPKQYASTTPSKSEHSSFFILQTKKEDRESLTVTESVNSPDGECATRITDPELMVFEAWRLAAGKHGWAQPRHLAADRRKAIRGRIADAGGVEGVLEALAAAERSRFLREGFPGWSLDWFLKPKNFRKVVEGNYSRDGHNGSTGSKAPPTASRMTTTVDLIRHLQEREASQ